MSSKLKHFRQLAGLTQAQLALESNFSQGQRRISYYEARKRLPKLDDCRIMVAVLNNHGVECSLDDVFPPETESGQVA